MIELAVWQLVALFVIGAYVGWKINDALFKYTFGKMLNDAGVTDAKLAKFIAHWSPIVEQEAGVSQVPEDTVAIKVELHHGVLYAFRKDNDAFLGQGETKDELTEAIRRKMVSGQAVTVEDEDGGHHFKEAK